MRHNKLRFRVVVASICAAGYACKASSEVEPLIEGDGGVAEGGVDVQTADSAIADGGRSDSLDAGSDVADASVTLTCLRSFGDLTQESVYGIAVDSLGNIAISGFNSAGTLDFGSGALPKADSGYSDYVAKFDKTCKLIWAKGWPNGAADRPLAVGVGFAASGDLWVGGEVRLTKLSGTDGSILQQTTYAGGGMTTTLLRIDSAGNIYLAGELAGDGADFGGGPLSSPAGTSMFVAKMDSNGGHVWSKSFGVEASVSSISVGPADDIFVAGFFIGSMDLGGGELGTGGRRSFVARLAAADGAHVWSQSFLAKDALVAVHPSGQVFVGGRNDGVGFPLGPGVSVSPDAGRAYLAKLAPDGGAQWAFGLDDVVIGLAASATDVRSFGSVLASYNAADGKAGWRIPLGTFSTSSPAPVVGPNGETVAAGAFSGTVATGTETVTSKGQRDIMLLRRP